MMRVGAGMLATLCVCAPPSMAAQETTSRDFPTDAAITSIIRKRVEQKRSAGIVVGLLEADGRRRIIAYGDPGPGQPALNGNSVFEIGSISKVFTATLLARMVLDGKVALDDPVQRFLPSNVRVPQRNGHQITLRTLSAQNSGLPRLPNNLRPRHATNPYADYSVQQMYEFLSTYELTRDPGAKFEYSNFGVGLLGHALSLAAGKPYEQAQRELIWQPLGMTHTGITLTPWMREHLALGHGSNGAVVPLWDIPTLAGAGAIRSNADDLLTFLAANLDTVRGPLARAMALTHQRQYAREDSTAIALNWFVRTATRDTILWHNGGTGGYRTFVAFSPRRKIAVVVLTNSGGEGADDIGFHLLDANYELTPLAPMKLVWISVGIIAVALALVIAAVVFVVKRIRRRAKRSGREAIARTPSATRHAALRAGVLFMVLMNSAACARAPAHATVRPAATAVHPLEGNWRSTDGRVLLTAMSRGTGPRLSNGRVTFENVAAALDGGGGRYSIVATMTGNVTAADIVQRGALRVAGDTAFLTPESNKGTNATRLHFQVLSSGELLIDDFSSSSWRFTRTK